MSARLLDDEDEADARHAQNDDRKLHENIGSPTCKRSLDEGLDEVLQYDSRHGVQTGRQRTKKSLKNNLIYIYYIDIKDKKIYIYIISYNLMYLLMYERIKIEFEYVHLKIKRVAMTFSIFLV